MLLNHQGGWGFGILAVFNNKPRITSSSSPSHQSPKSNVQNLKVNDFMGHRSMRKKNIILKQQQQPMPSSSSFNSNSNSFKTRHVVVLVSFLSAVAVIALSLNTWSSFRSDGRAVLSHQVYSYEVVNVFPHDPNAFTQGLLYGGNDTLLESTGLNGQSSVREVDLQTGKIKAIQNMDYSYFREGLTLLGKRCAQQSRSMEPKLRFILRMISDEKHLRFRQNLPNVMDHYVEDCWMAEIETSFSWSECVWIADKSHEKIGVALEVKEKLEQPTKVEETGSSYVIAIIGYHPVK